MKELFGIKAAVFDLDGTLFDSARLWERIDDEFLRRRGRTPTAEYKRGIAALGNREVARFTVEFYGLKDTPEELMREWADMARHEYANAIRLFDGAREYIERTAAEGIIALAVTSLARELAEPCLENNGIYKYFKEILTADETGLSKTSPDIYRFAAEKVGAPPSSCVAFDDVPIAIRSAKLAGMTTVAISSGNASDFDGIADYVVKSLNEAPLLHMLHKDRK